MTPIAPLPRFTSRILPVAATGNPVLAVPMAGALLADVTGDRRNRGQTTVFQAARRNRGLSPVLRNRGLSPVLRRNRGLSPILRALR